MFKTTTKSEEVSPSGRIPIEELSESMDLIQRSLREGRAHLMAVAYPWGVELDVVREEIAFDR